MSPCASVTLVRAPERTGLAKGCAGIVIATETAAGRGAVRCCNLENASYPGEDSNEIDGDPSTSLQGISFHLYLSVLCSKDMTLQSFV